MAIIISKNEKYAQINGKTYKVSSENEFLYIEVPKSAVMGELVKDLRRDLFVLIKDHSNIIRFDFFADGDDEARVHFWGEFDHVDHVLGLKTFNELFARVVEKRDDLSIEVLDILGGGAMHIGFWATVKDNTVGGIIEQAERIIVELLAPANEIAAMVIEKVKEYTE